MAAKDNFIKNIFSISFVASMLALAVLIVGWLYFMDEAERRWLPANVSQLLRQRKLDLRPSALREEEFEEVDRVIQDRGDFEMSDDLPADFEGPGGCIDRSSCSSYCAQHREECLNFERD